MILDTQVGNNENFFVKNGKLFNVNKQESLCEINDMQDYYYGTHISYFEKGARVENNNFGHIDYSFFDNKGDLLANIEEDNIQQENEIYMYVLKKGILSVAKDFSDFPVYKWTNFDGKTTVNYNLDNIVKVINNDEQQLESNEPESPTME